MVSELGGPLEGSVDEAAQAIMALMPSAPQVDASDEDEGQSDSVVAQPEESSSPSLAEDAGSIPADDTISQNTDEEAPQGEEPVEAEASAPDTQPKAQAPQAPTAPQVRPQAAQAQPNAAQHLQQLTQHVTQLQAGLQAAFPDIKSLDDLKRLAVEDPARVIAFNAHERELQVARAYLPQVQAAAQAEWEQAETAKLHDMIPELKDSAKGPKLKEQIAAYAKEAGYSPEQLATVSAVQVKTLYEAMQYRQFKAKQDAELAKQAKAIVEAKNKAKDAPPVQKPGSPKGTDGKAAKAAELLAKHQKSGRVDDLAAYLTFTGQG